MIKASTRSKARSRLKSSHADDGSDRGTTTHARKSSRSQSPHDSRLIRYIRHFPLLVLSIPGFAICYWIINSVYPEDIAHWLIPNAYLAIQVPFFLSTVFFWSYLFLNTRQGIVMSVVSSLLLFMRLQQVVFEMLWLAPLLAIALILLFLVKNGHSHLSG